MEHPKIINAEIFDDYTRNTVILIPVDGSFEYRIESAEFPEGIKEHSLHGQFIKLYGADRMKSGIDSLIKSRQLILNSPREFSKACRTQNAALGECITLHGNHGVRFCLAVTCWLNKDGKAFLSNKEEDELKIFNHILKKITDFINDEYSNELDIRLPMLGTGVLRSQIKHKASDKLRNIQLKFYENNLRNHTWKIYKKNGASNG